MARCPRRMSRRRCARCGVALLEADVALPVVRSFTDQVRDKADRRRRPAARSRPGQMVVKIVHDDAGRNAGHRWSPTSTSTPPPPVVIMMVGLQGSGKTTTSAKIAKRLTERQSKKVLMASLDTRRPAAQEQLAVSSGEQIERRDAADRCGPEIRSISPGAPCRRPSSAVMTSLILDTAGRTAYRRAADERDGRHQATCRAA